MKWLILSLTKLKFLSTIKFVPLLSSIGTMFLSVFVYGLFFGWGYAVGIIFLLVLHESGHYYAAKRKNLDVGLPTFIPFVGAWIQLKEQPMTVETEAYVALAGPYVGTIAALGCYGVARYFDSDLLLAVSYVGFLLNLVNLIPISPLDGGRITAILSPRIWIVGAIMLVACFIYRPSPMILLIAIFALPQLWYAFRFDPKLPENKRYYTVSTITRIEYGGMYLVLSGFLALMTFQVYEMLPNR